MEDRHARCPNLSVKMGLGKFADFAELWNIYNGEQPVY